MSLEKDIKQSQFKNEYQKALLNILYTNNHLINQMNVVFKKNNITRQQYNVLRILRGQHPKPVSINLIKERMLDKMSDASRIVERLRIKGLISRNVSDHDRRSVEITISAPGLDFLNKTDTEISDLEKLLDNLKEDEAQQLNTLLDKLRG